MSRSLLRRLGLRLLPLLHPTREEDRRDAERLTAAVAAQREQFQRQHEELKELRRDLRQVQDRLSEARTEMAAGFGHQRDTIETWGRDIGITQRDNTRRLQTTISRHSVFLKGVLRNARHISQHAVAEERVLERLARVAAGRRPIIVGPWTGEVGFELVYWVPFVRWFVERFAVDPARLVVVSRGGPVSWYGELGARYSDVIEFVEPVDLIDPGRTRKQRHLGQRDRGVIRQLARRVGRPVSVLHPLHLYALCGAYFDGFMGVRPMLEVLRHRRIEAPARALVPDLPDQFVAAKFYFSAAFPDTTENRKFTDAMLAQIASRWPVVLLDHGVKIDDHVPYGSGRYLDLSSIGAEVTPRNNLEIQTAVVAHARAFVGTYGGFSYLAPMCGVDSLAFHSKDEFYGHHRHLADVVFSRLHAPALMVLPTQAADLAGDLVGFLSTASERR